MDYRALDAPTVKNCCPIPLVRETLSRIQGKKYFTKFDSPLVAVGVQQVTKTRPPAAVGEQQVNKTSPPAAVGVQQVTRTTYAPDRRGFFGNTSRSGEDSREVPRRIQTNAVLQLPAVWLHAHPPYLISDPPAPADRRQTERQKQRTSSVWRRATAPRRHRCAERCATFANRATTS